MSLLIGGSSHGLRSQRNQIYGDTREVVFHDFGVDEWMIRIGCAPLEKKFVAMILILKKKF